MKPENPKPLGHDVVLEYIPLLVNGSLDKDTKASVEAHIHSCKECQLELSFERSVQSATKPGKDVSSLCLLYTSPSPRDLSTSRMPSSA